MWTENQGLELSFKNPVFPGREAPQVRLWASPAENGMSVKRGCPESPDHRLLRPIQRALFSWAQTLPRGQVALSPRQLTAKGSPASSLTCLPRLCLWQEPGPLVPSRSSEGGQRGEGSPPTTWALACPHGTIQCRDPHPRQLLPGEGPRNQLQATPDPAPHRWVENTNTNKGETGWRSVNESAGGRLRPQARQGELHRLLSGFGGQEAGAPSGLPPVGMVSDTSITVF